MLAPHATILSYFGGRTARFALDVTATPGESRERPREFSVRFG